MTEHLGPLISRRHSSGSLKDPPHPPGSAPGKRPGTLSRSQSAVSLSHGRRVPFCYPFASQNALITKGEPTHLDALSHKCHPFSIILATLFVACYRKINLPSVFVAVLIFLCVRESLQTVRLARTDGALFKLRTAFQLVGDLLMLPYHLAFKPPETPLLQFQGTELNRFLVRHLKSAERFSQTPWAVHAYVQFTLLVLEEKYRAKEKLDIFRELVDTPDGGLVALDWWLPAGAGDGSARDGREGSARGARRGWKYCESKCGKYKSKVFYQFEQSEYDRHFAGGAGGGGSGHRGGATPILFVFSTYFGDSMGAPQKKLCKYFARRGWKVVVFCKRGCGSPYVEMLPLTNCRLFDLRGMGDSRLVVDVVARRYPRAPMYCAGFSVGGNMVHDFLATLNDRRGEAALAGGKRRYFDGGIKIDGLTCWVSDLLKFNRRQPLVSQVLAELPFTQLQGYVKNHLAEAEHCGYNLKAFLLGEHASKTHGSMEDTKTDGKSEDGAKESASDDFATSMSDVDMNYVVKHLFSVGSESKMFDSSKWVQYCQTCGPCDIELVDSPMLVLNSWNDSFQSPDDNPIGIAQVNPNIIHCVSRGGAHCIRREGCLFNRCWISKVSYQYLDALLKYQTRERGEQ